MDNHQTLVARTRAHNLISWTAQETWDPLSIVRGEGAYFWDADGVRYLDWSSQLFNLNLGHGDPIIRSAVHEQVDRLQYALPGLASEPRAVLAEQLAEIAPAGLTHTFFTTGGADAVENAIKVARLATGRQKILSRYRSYHGATFGAMSAGGDPRRNPNEPGVPWIVRMPDPYAYRGPHYRGRTVEAGERAVVDAVEDIIRYEGPENIAAILLEGYSGTSGIIQGGETYWRGIQALKEKYGLLLIVDEVLSGFGRTGKWFGIEHYPWVEPDLIAMAKGLTAGYIPLGAVMMSAQIAERFDRRTFFGGLTYSGHPVACAAGIGALESYRENDAIANAHRMGVELRAGLFNLAEKHELIGDVRGAGLHYVIELVKDRDTKAPLSEFNAPPSAGMRRIAAGLRAAGMSTFVKWNFIFCAPPLIAAREDIRTGLEIIDGALEKAALD